MDIGEVLVREAKGGAAWAIKLVIASQLPTARERTVPFDLPKLDTASDVPAAIRSVLDAISACEMTPGEGNSVIAGARGVRQVADALDPRLAYSHLHTGLVLSRLQ
jgi:hypothetical protein